MVADGEQSMERNDQNDAHVKQKALISASRTALVLYASEAGNAQDVAEEVGRMAERLRFDTTVLDLDSVQLRDLLKPSVIIFVVSTTGQGEMPQNARVFWKRLLSGALRPGVLRKIRFASFGLGDSSYARYNVAHRMLCSRLIQLGAQMFCERGEGNDQHPEGYSAGFQEWIVPLRKQLLATFPLPDGIDPIANDVFLEPKWRLELLEECRENGNPSLPAIDRQEAHPEQTPSTALLPIKGSHRADIVSNERVTTADHFQDVRVLDLRIDEAHHYRPGAIAVVYPKNFPSDVEEFIELMGWGEVADLPLVLKSTLPGTSADADALSPLRQFDLSDVRLTLRWLLENILDFMGIPRRSFFAELAHFLCDSTEDEQYQKERLLELANPELIDELWDYTTRPKRTTLEVMMDFTELKIPWQYALTLLPTMKGRQFSIASGGDLCRDGNGRTRVQLLVAIADPPSPIIKYRRRHGVCTRYIATLKAGESINIGMQPGYLDVQPSEMKVPIIMVGPGTGLAPMRSMVYQRLAWAKTLPECQGQKSLQGDTLIFGCRNSEADFFFRAEWEHLQEYDSLNMLTAFSRSKDKPKQYVQDVIRANATLVLRTLVERNGKFYLCGSSGNMPKGVRQALVEVLSGPEGGMSEDDANAYLDGMEKEGRYKQETW